MDDLCLMGIVEAWYMYMSHSGLLRAPTCPPSPILIVMELSPLHGLAFSTTSDALLAQLLVEKDFAIGQVSKMIQLFCGGVSGGFRQSDLSLRDVADAYAVTRRERSLSHSCLHGNIQSRFKALTTKSAGIPNLVLDLVVQHFSATRRPFHKLAVSFSLVQPLLCDNERALMSMSMVHRTWTTLAQRALARRIRIRGVEGIRRAMALTSIGPWTREVLFSCATRFDYDGDFDGEAPSEVFPYLNALVRKLQNIQLLSVWTYFDEFNFDVGLMRGFLDALKNLDRLKGLWLSHRNFSGAIMNGINPCFAELCLALPCYHSLQALHLEGWSTPTQKPRRLLRSTQTYLRIPKWKLRSYASPPPPPMEVTPSRSLRRLSLKWYTRRELPLWHVEWLLRRRGEYGIMDFALDLQMDCDEDVEMAEVFEPVAQDVDSSMRICDPRRFVASISKHLSEMTTVQLDICEDPWSSSNEPHGPGTLLAPIIDTCSSVQRLHITLHSNTINKSGVHLDSCIASTVEELYVQVDAPYGYEDFFFLDVDVTLLRLLERNELPVLRKFVFVAWMPPEDDSVGGTEDGDDSAAYFPTRNDPTNPGRYRMRTSEYCVSKGIRFVHLRENVSLVMRDI